MILNLKNLNKYAKDLNDALAYLFQYGYRFVQG